MSSLALLVYYFRNNNAGSPNFELVPDFLFGFFHYRMHKVATAQDTLVVFLLQPAPSCRGRPASTSTWWGPGVTKTDATAGLPAGAFAQTAPHTSLRRLAEPEGISRVVLFPAAEMSDDLTGHHMPANSGAFML